MAVKDAFIGLRDSQYFSGLQVGQDDFRKHCLGFSTAFLMAVSENHIFFSTNVRGYLVIMMLALMAVTCVLDRLEGHLLKFKKLSNGFNVVLAFLAGWLFGFWEPGRFPPFYSLRFRLRYF